MQSFEIKFEKNSQLQSNLIFPEKMEEICLHSFFSAENIQFVQFLADSVYLESSCFYLCNKLTLILFENATEIWFNNSFRGMDGYPIIFIRCDAKIHRNGGYRKSSRSEFDQSQYYNEFKDDDNDSSSKEDEDDDDNE